MEFIICDSDGTGNPETGEHGAETAALQKMGKWKVKMRNRFRQINKKETFSIFTINKKWNCRLIY
jgi:hypothetical protein